MNHLEGHLHAFLDNDNNVINVAVFNEHNTEILEAVKVANNCASYICCCDNGIAVIGGKWNGEFFTDAQGDRIPPSLPPTDARYEYDWSEGKWVYVGEIFVMPTE